MASALLPATGRPREPPVDRRWGEEHTCKTCSLRTFQFSHIPRCPGKQEASPNMAHFAELRIRSHTNKWSNAPRPSPHQSGQVSAGLGFQVRPKHSTQ